MPDEIRARAIQWEGESWVVEVNGKVVGSTLRKGEAVDVAGWLQRYKRELLEAINLPQTPVITKEVRHA